MHQELADDAWCAEKEVSAAFSNANPLNGALATPTTAKIRSYSLNPIFKPTEIHFKYDGGWLGEFSPEVKEKKNVSMGLCQLPSCNPDIYEGDITKHQIYIQIYKVFSCTLCSLLV